MKVYQTSLLLLLTVAVTAQFPEIAWRYDMTAPAFGSAAAADLDGDGYYEIVFTTYTNDGRAHCLNAEDGSISWIFDLGGCGDVAPIIYDVNNDDTLDIIINGSCNPTLFCINGVTGKLIWSVYSGGGDSPPTIADIDQDQKPELLFGNFQGELRILNAEDGSTNKIIQVIPSGHALQNAPGLVDINGDGKLEIILSNYLNQTGLYTWAFDFTSGSILWENKIVDDDASFHAYHVGAIADIDLDQKMEYVVGSGAGFVQAINVEDGSQLWKIDIPTSLLGAVTIADLEQDGELEIIVNNNDVVNFDKRIRVLDGRDGEEQWSVPIDFSSFRGMSVSDINGNGMLDLISGHFLGKVMAVEPYNGVIWEMDLRDHFSADLPYLQVDQQPLVADFDQNGTVDVFVQAGYGTYIPDSLNTGAAFMIEAGSGTCPEWLMFRHDIRRSGYLPANEIDSLCNFSSHYQSENYESALTIFPNPTSASIHIEGINQMISDFRLELVDMNGKQVWNYDSKSGGHHHGHMAIDMPASIADGLFLVKIIIDENTTHNSIIIVNRN